MTLRTLTPSMWLTLSLAAAMLLLGVTGAGNELLQFHRSAIDTGQWWRLLTGHGVHYGAYHLVINLVALLIIGYVLLKQLSLGAYVGLLVLSALVISAGLLTGEPDLEFYRGFSGVLHGLLVTGLLVTWRETPLLNGAALLVVTYKLWSEQQPEFDATHALLPVDVAVNAHLYGALAGLAYGLLFLLLRQLKHRRR